LMNNELKTADSKMHDHDLETNIKGLCWSSIQTCLLEVIPNGILNEQRAHVLFGKRWRNYNRKRISIGACRWNYEGLPYMYFYMCAEPCNVFMLQLATCFCLADAWPNKIDFYKKVKACTCKQS